MGRPKGSIALKDGDRWSDLWSGHIEMADGKVRKPIMWRGKCTNVYFAPTYCRMCKKLMLQRLKHVGKRPFCSPECKSRFFKTRNQGARSKKKLDGQQGYYVLVRDANHPRSVRGKVREHLLVMEKKIGRPIKPEERVHHIDLIKSNNSQGNLFLFASNADHIAAHVSLNKCVAGLLKSGVLIFDERSGKYRIPNKGSSKRKSPR